MKRTRTETGKTFEVEVGGKKRRVTVPDDPRPEDILLDALRETLSPQAVAAIAAHLHGIVRTKDEKVNREVAWFTEQLLEILGDRYNGLCDEIGL